MDILLNHICKPDRVVYYIEPTPEEKEAYYKGIIPQAFEEYAGAFGTYDCPGLFRINKDGKVLEIIGLEFRPNDKNIVYPDNLKSIFLKGRFMISALITNEISPDDDMVDECISDILSKMGYNPFHRGVMPKKDSDIVQIFTTKNKNRVLVEAEDISEEEYFQTATPVTEEEKCLYRAAYHDPITGFYNWNYLNPIISGFGLKGVQDFSFVHFDVKDFNTINLIYGHDIANRVLTRITENISRQDWVYFGARCDNDNFAMMIKDMPEEETRCHLQKFFEDISILDEDNHYHIYYRAGVVPMRNCLLSGSRVADAGKLAQRLGNKLNETEILFYTDAMHDQLDWAKKIKAYLDIAIEKDEFIIYLQPKYDVSNERIRGAEALIRWKYQGRELLSPFKFIPVFERDGSISKIDDIVLHKVCQCFKKWKEEGLPLYPISVNLSRKRMGNSNLIEHLTSIVDSYEIDHSLVDFELTESAAYDNQDYMISVISELKNRGFKVSMDDFGTGYSSLSLLTLMPIDTLKIDKSFVDGIGTPKETYKERAVIKHIISMATALNLTCLAEGAEEKTQVDKLRDFGCELIQGYYYSKPLPVEEYEAKLRAYT